MCSREPHFEKYCSTSWLTDDWYEYWCKLLVDWGDKLAQRIHRFFTGNLNSYGVEFGVTLGPTVIRPFLLGDRHPSGAHIQMFISVRLLWICWYWTPSLTRGRVVVYNSCWFRQHSHSSCDVLIEWRLTEKVGSIRGKKGSIISSSTTWAALGQTSAFLAKFPLPVMLPQSELQAFSYFTRLH
jgi:hypothetical protein